MSFRKTAAVQPRSRSTSFTCKLQQDMGEAALDLLQSLEEDLQIEIIEQFDIQGASVASIVLQHTHVHGATDGPTTRTASSR